MLTESQRADLIARYAGQPGLQKGREEAIGFEEHADGVERVVLYTTRPATVADLLESDRPVESVEDKGETIRVVLPASEYRMGGILGALRRRVEMSEEQRRAAGERMCGLRAGA